MTEGFIIKEGVLETYTGREKVIRVPDEVCIIGTGAFKGCTSLEQVYLPNTVTSIMDDAFKGCRNLKDINFPTKLKEIGNYAFHRCHSLIHVELPQSVKVLGNCVFLYCDSLEHISIPGVTILGKQVFLNDVNLRSLNISKDLNQECICDVFTGCSKITDFKITDMEMIQITNGIEVISSDSNAHPLIKAIVLDIYRMMEIEDGVLLRFLTNLKHVDVPEGITSLAKSCFFDKKGVITVKLPKSLKEIGSRAFRNCINLEKITFANDDVKIDKDAFKNCTTLKYITTSDKTEYELSGLAHISDKSRPKTVRTIHSQILDNFFISGTTLVRYRGNEERVSIPDGIEVIGEKAFSGNEAVGRVILPDTIKEIQENAFSDCLLLQTINFPEGILEIGKSAFENCVKLIRAILPETLKILKRSVFNRCKKLNEVHLGSKVKQIESLAFYSCFSLKKISFPEGLEKLEDMAFYKCLALKDITLPKTLRILGNNIFTLSGVKSAQIKGEPEHWGTDVFSQCNKLRKLTFDEGIQQIGDKFAFCCSSLKYVNLPESIRYIGKNAFEDSIYIKDLPKKGVIGNILVNGEDFTEDIIIPEGITSIAGGAFYGNTNITSVRFPETLERIGSRAFCGCTSLKKVLLPTHITELEEGVFSYCNALTTIKTNGVITRISDSAFYDCHTLEEVPTSEATYIGKNAFYGCEKLTKPKINSPTIGEDAFKGTDFLNNMRDLSPLIIISGTVIEGVGCNKKVEIPEGTEKISPYAFAGNDKITEVIFPESMLDIGDGAFSGCKNLKKICFPSQLNHIGKKAFEKCTSLTEVYACIEEVEDGAFSYCMNLNQAVLTQPHTLGKEVFCGCNTLEIFKCSDLKTIGDGCFRGCESLQAFDFSNIEFIGKYAFSDCNCLKEITLKENIIISAHAFEDCGNLETISLSDDCPKFGSYAFSGCTRLKYINTHETEHIIENYSLIFDENISNDVKSIYRSSISCFDINEDFVLEKYLNHGRFIRIPNGITAIQNEVFKDAMNLEEIEIPDEVEYIGSRAFQSTPWLEKQKSATPMVIINNILIDGTECKGIVEIPKHVKIVSGWAFANCFGLEEIRFLSKHVKVEEYAFRNCINLKKIITADSNEYVLTGISDRNLLLPPLVKQIITDCYNCFKTDENNVLMECTGNIGTLILAEGIRAVGDNVFKDSNLLTDITLVKETESIGKSSFEHCKWLVHVRNALSVRKIEKLAFSGCTLLEDIELSDKLQEIGVRSFEHCTSLKQIRLPEGITTIPEKAFYRCHNLKSISLPSTLHIIEKEAFAFCYNLERIEFPKALERIDARAFAWCPELNSKQFPKAIADKNVFGEESL